MKVLNLLARGNIGGVEVLCKNYINTSSHENIVVFLWGEGSVGEEIETAGNKVIDLKCSHFNIAEITRKVLAVCDEYMIECIIANHSVAAIHACLIMIKKKRPNIKMVFYAQSNAERICRADHAILKPIQNSIIKSFYRKADLVIAISESVKKSLIDVFGKRKDEPIVVYNGVSNEMFGAIHQGGHEIPQLIYVGRLIDEKGVQITLDALSGIDIPFCFKVVGDGEYRQTLEQQCERLGLTDRVEFLGARRDIGRLLSMADYFIHMPLCQEGFGLTVVEAMAAGLICIVNNNGALPEIVTDGVDGYIVDLNVENFRARLEKILCMYGSELEYSIREKAIEKAMNYSIEAYGAKMDELLDSLICF